MNARQFVIFLVAAALAAPLIKKLWEASQANVGSSLPNIDRSQTVAYVEEALHNHQGEDTPLVQAFESALEQETRHGDPTPA